MSQLKIATLFAGVLSILALAGCAKPLPPDRMSYAGEWRGAGMRLLITPEGNVEYERSEGSTSKSVNAPLKEFQGDDFIVGVGSLTTKFAVSVPPHQGTDTWEMTVDGVELKRVPGGTI
jgi:hypothetical protein